MLRCESPRCSRCLSRNRSRNLLRGLGFAAALACLLAAQGCAPSPAPSIARKTMEVTAYCSCGECCGWERGSDVFLCPDYYSRFVKGSGYKKQYTGCTASGSKPEQYHPGLFSLDSLDRPWTIPFRIIFPPWWFARDGAIAADTQYYPFGTRLYVPGYGWGVVRDRGSAIKGPQRLDVFYDSHADADEWGRKKLAIEIYRTP